VAERTSEEAKPPTTRRAFRTVVMVLGPAPLSTAA